MRLILLMIIPTLFSIITLFRDLYINKLKYRLNNYFNINTIYIFENNLNQRFESKVEFYNGNYYTTIKDRCNYKATTIKCKKL